MKVPADLKPLLVNLGNNGLAYGEKARLIFICRSIAESLLSVYHRGALSILSSEGWSLWDISWDCIAEMFAEDSRGTPYRLEIFLSKLEAEPAAMPDLRLFLALKAYIGRYVSFRITKLLTEADPEGRRVARNIREALRRRTCSLRLSRDFRGEILVPRESRMSRTLPEFPPELLEQKILVAITGERSVIRILGKIAGTLEDQTEYQCSARLVDVVGIIKRSYADIFHLEGDGKDEVERIEICADDAEMIDVVRRSALRKVAEKVEATYYRTNKITETDAKKLLLTVRMILDDWLEGNRTNHDYYMYAANELGCSRQDYNERWSTRIHYLVKLMRGYLKDQLEAMSSR